MKTFVFFHVLLKWKHAAHAFTVQGEVSQSTSFLALVKWEYLFDPEWVTLFPDYIESLWRPFVPARSAGARCGTKAASMDARGRRGVRRGAVSEFRSGKQCNLVERLNRVHCASCLHSPCP